MTQKNPTQFRGSKRGQSQISQNYSSSRGAASPSPPLTRVTRLAKDRWAQFSSGSSAHVASLMLDKLLKNV